jgi:hypothetical protein
MDKLFGDEVVDSDDDSDASSQADDEEVGLLNRPQVKRSHSSQ